MITRSSVRSYLVSCAAVSTVFMTGFGLSQLRSTSNSNTPEIEASMPADQHLRYDVLILFEHDSLASAIDLLQGESGIEIRRVYKHLPIIAANVSVDALHALSKHPDILVVEPDLTATIMNQELDDSWGVKRIGGGFAHTQGHCGDGVRIAILDTGIDYTHPEIAAAFAGGYDFVNDDDDPMDDHGHGTAVAGIIGSARDGVGVVGAAPCSDLYAVKVINAHGSAQLSDIIAGIDWCVDNKIDVANLSLGLPIDPGQAFRTAFETAEQAGVLNVASAGAFGSQGVAYPAAYESVIAVSATDEQNQVASFSGIGPEIELAAPGVNIKNPRGQWGIHDLQRHFVRRTTCRRRRRSHLRNRHRR